MNVSKLKRAVQAGRIEWEVHSLQRMMERNISRKDVLKVLLEGEIIEDYHDHKPYPSALFLGWPEKRPVHVVAAYDEFSNTGFVITTYVPDLKHFKSGFKTRKNK